MSDGKLRIKECHALECFNHARDGEKFCLFHMGSDSTPPPASEPVCGDCLYPLAEGCLCASK